MQPRLERLSISQSRVRHTVPHCTQTAALTRSPLIKTCSGKSMNWTCACSRLHFVASHWRSIKHYPCQVEGDLRDTSMRHSQIMVHRLHSHESVYRPSTPQPTGMHCANSITPERLLVSVGRTQPRKNGSRCCSDLLHEASTAEPAILGSSSKPVTIQGVSSNAPDGLR
jgi:hypothetical protein